MEEETVLSPGLDLVYLQAFFIVVVEVGGAGEAEEEVGEGADDVPVRPPVVEREVAEQQLVEPRPVAAPPCVPQPERGRHLLHGPQEVAVRVRRVRRHRRHAPHRVHRRRGGVHDGV